MDEQQRSGFWSTLPGILTGSAALITAATGGYIAFDRTQGSPAPKPSQIEGPAEPKPLALVGATPAEASTSEARALAASPTTPLPSPPSRQNATGVPKPSFNCALAATAVETMLCSDAGLAERDRQVAAQYFVLRGTLPPNVKSQLLQSQRYFLERRSECTTTQCLSDVYDNRLHQLADFASN